jgi:hypothetical protein
MPQLDFFIYPAIISEENSQKNTRKNTRKNIKVSINKHVI